MERQGRLQVTQLLAEVVGFGLYGLLEYSVHPWADHDDRSPAAPGHRWHHDDPEALIAAPFFTPALVLVGLWGLFRWSLGDEAATWLVGALVTGFLMTSSCIIVRITGDSRCGPSGSSAAIIGSIISSPIGTSA